MKNELTPQANEIIERIANKITKERIESEPEIAEIADSPLYPIDSPYYAIWKLTNDALATIHEQVPVSNEPLELNAKIALQFEQASRHLIDIDALEENFALLAIEKYPLPVPDKYSIANATIIKKRKMFILGLRAGYNQAMKKYSSKVHSELLNK